MPGKLNLRPNKNQNLPQLIASDPPPKRRIGPSRRKALSESDAMLAGPIPLYGRTRKRPAKMQY